MSLSVDLADIFANLAVAPTTERHVEEPCSTNQERAQQQRRLVRFSKTGRKTIRYFDINSRKAFEERIVFRAQCLPSIPQSRLDRSVNARLLLRERASPEEMKNFVNFHGYKGAAQRSPLISATPDLLRALNHGRELRNAGYKDVCLVLIDLWEMPKGAFGSCNTIRQKLALTENNVYKTEILMWQDIPPNAILSIASFEELSTGIFGQCFPTIFEPFSDVPKLPLSDLRAKVAQTATKVDLSPQALCHLLTEELCLEPYWLLTWQMGQALLESYMRSKSDILEHLDMCLYYVECQRRIEKAASCVSKAILDQYSPKSATWLASAFTLPELSSWVASRAEQNIISYDDSALTHSAQIDMLQYVENWTGSHVYERLDGPRMGASGEIKSSL